jgi:hypothetical protein
MKTRKDNTILALCLFLPLPKKTEPFGYDLAVGDPVRDADDLALPVKLLYKPIKSSRSL